MLRRLAAFTLQQSSTRLIRLQLNKTAQINTKISPLIFPLKGSNIRNYSTAPTDYESISDETLEALCEHLESLIDDNSKLSEADVTLASGVLSLVLPDPFGTYVINKQSPNKQIWLSSPRSGPIR